MSTTLVRARVEATRASRVNQILDSIGLTPGDAVKMLYAQIEAMRGIPFAVQQNGYAYAMSEYGATREEVDALAARMEKNYRREKKAGTIRRARGIADLRE